MVGASSKMLSEPAPHFGLVCILLVQAPLLKWNLRQEDYMEEATGKKNLNLAKSSNKNRRKNLV